MDFFGRFLFDYWKKGEKSSTFYFIENKKKKFPVQTSRYFREYKDFSSLEKKGINLSRGMILDVGCATGYHVPALMEKGDVDAIDISKHAIKIAKENGLDNCYIVDIFKYKPSKKYDTIILFENNIGLAGTVSKTKKLLKALVSILKEDGQIICEIVRTRNVDTWTVLLTPLWNGKTGKSFKWLHFSINFLSRLCAKFGLDLEILEEKEISGNIWSLIRMFKSKKVYE
jgi:SAM-dependent methyltransferase